MEEGYKQTKEHIEKNKNAHGKDWQWTKEQIDFLKKHYHQKFLKDMLNLELFKNKTFSALNCECWRLGLKRSQKGKHNHNWRGGKRKDRGYIKLFGQYNCPYANENGTIREHIFVWWKHYGDKNPIVYGEVIHHINGDKTDNRIENLKKMKKWEHDKLPKKTILEDEVDFSRRLEESEKVVKLA